MNIRSMYRVRTRQCWRGVPIYLPFQAHKVNKQQARSQDIFQGTGVQTADPQSGYFLRGRGANSRPVVRIFPRGPGCKQQARGQDIPQGVAKRGVVVWDQDHQVKRSKKFCNFNLKTNIIAKTSIFSLNLMRR